MGKLSVFLFICLIVLNHSHAQQIQNPTIKAESYYLQKSHSQKTTAYALLGGGAIAAGVGFIWASDDVEANGIFNADFGGQIVLVSVGMLAMIGSIPLFVSARHNHEKSMMLSAQFKGEAISQKLVTDQSKYFPSIRLVIPISR